MIIAVDYDDTIIQNGSVYVSLVQYLIEQQKHGAKVILWTCRVGERRDEAVEVCRRHGLVFDEVAVGKPLADVYIDDKAKRPDEVLVSGGRQRLTSLRKQRRGDK